MINPIQAPATLIDEAFGFSLLNEKYKIKPTKGKNNPNINQPKPPLELEVFEDEFE